MENHTISIIGVAGAGTMGAGIAQVALRNGYSVILHDALAKALESAQGRIAKGLARDVEKGRWTEPEKKHALERLQIAADAGSLAKADMVIEAVSENFAIKSEVLRALDAACPPEVILGTNTSSISITRLAAVTGRASQFVGIHFFNPVPAMKLVEVVPGIETAEETIVVAEKLAKSVGKTPVRAQDAPGFVSNRLLMPMINEAVFALAEGVADAHGIDDVMKLGMNHPMGPLELADLIGLDVCLDIMRVLYDGFHDSKYRPCPLLEKMVAAGRLGRKSGRGFYEYPAGGN